MRTTGAPCFVTMIGWPLACTASISFRQLALNSDAAIVLVAPVLRPLLTGCLPCVVLNCNVHISYKVAHPGKYRRSQNIRLGNAGPARPCGHGLVSRLRAKNRFHNLSSLNAPGTVCGTMGS